MRRAFATIAAACIAVTPATAEMVSFLPTSAVWQNAILTNGGVATYNQINATTAQVSWGNPVNAGQQSSYLISANVIDPVVVTPPAASPLFQFANFTHNNFPINLNNNGPTLQYVELVIAGNVFVDGNDIGVKTFYFDFLHEETPNGNGFPISPFCPYGGANLQGVNLNGCADRVDDFFSYDSDMFKIGATDYYLDPGQFRINGVDAPAFLTKENGANHAQLLGYFVPVGGALNAVPEPASWAMMIAGFGIAGAVLRRRAVPAHAFAIRTA
jgi:hypothetical protein